MSGIRTTGSFSSSARRSLSGFVLSVTMLKIVALLFDLCALVLAYRTALPTTAFLIETFGTSSLGDLFQSGQRHMVTGFILSLGALIAFFFGGHYTKRIPWWSQIQFIGKVVLFALLIEGFSAYILGLNYSRILIVTYWAMTFGFLVLSRIALYRVKVRTASWKLATVIVGDIGAITDTLFAVDSDRSMGLDPHAVLLRDKAADLLDREELPARYRAIRIMDGLTGCRDFIAAHPDYYYVIAMDSFRGDRRDSLIKLLTEKNIRFAIIPSISRTSLYQSKPLYFFGNDVMMLGARGYAMTPLQKILKRGMDVTGALVGLAFFGVPMLAVGAFLKLEGQGGTLLYGGERVGQNGRIFRCWKFRTMEPGTDHLLHRHLAENPQAKAYWGRYFKLPDDPRVQTRTARIIRKTSIDELPQLWNVLKGDMSLVGPRPILPGEIEAYGDKYPEYASLKPGMTGLWQVSGRNGTSFHRRIVWDSWYVRNWSLWGDIVIILKTIYVVLNRSGAS